MITFRDHADLTALIAQNSSYTAQRDILFMYSTGGTNFANNYREPDTLEN